MSRFEISEARRSSGMNKKVIYQLFLRCFSEDGTIRAATDKLEHIASLGVDIVYLVSFCQADGDSRKEYWSPRQRQSGIDNPKNPYRIGDYFKIDEEYGTHEDFRKFVNCAHELGLLVMTDLVYLHCGPGEFAEKHERFLKHNENGEIIYNSYHFPELDFDNDGLCEYLWDNMLFWVKEFDVDGYRCDVGESIPLWFWREGRTRIEKIKPQFLMLNEGEKSDYLVDVFDATYDFLWGKHIRRAVRREFSSHDVRCAAVGVAAKHPDGALVLRAYENHDYTNDSYSRRLDRIQPENTEAALVINFILDGVPFLYNGNEFADCRRHSMWRLAGDEFSIDWSTLQTQSGQRRMELVRRLCNLRHTIPALYEGITEWEKHPRLVKFSRITSDTTVYLAANLGDDSVVEKMPKGDIILSARIQLDGDTVILEPSGYIVIRRDNE